MILLYIIGALLALLLLCILFLGIYCLFINPEKEYDKKGKVCNAYEKLVEEVFVYEEQNSTEN